MIREFEHLDYRDHRGSILLYKTIELFILYILAVVSLILMFTRLGF